MRVHLIKKGTIEEYVEDNAQSRSSFSSWVRALKLADWKRPNDIIKTFGSADLLGNGTNRVVFDLAGNKYRMICKYVFGENEVHLFIKWIGTHAEYTKLCKENKQFTINVF